MNGLYRYCKFNKEIPTPIIRLKYININYIVFKSKCEKNDNTSCSICLESFSDLEMISYILKCRHIYHKECFTKWYNNQRQICPLCNE